jgi:hypothetical protein
VLVCLNVALAGLLTPEPSLASRPDTTAAIHAISVMPASCDHGGGKSSPGHPSNRTCDGCLNCFTFAPAPFAVAAVAAPSAVYTFSSPRLPASRSIIPPSPPPKPFVQL